MRAAVLALVFLPGWATGQDWGGEDDWLEDDALDAVKTKDVSEIDGPSNWSLTGFARSDWAAWVERLADDPWAKGRQSLDLTLEYNGEAFRLKLAGHGEWDARYLVGREDFDDAHLEQYELRYLDGEQFIARSAGEFEVTFGRQIVAWGEGDVLSPLDVVNPRDNREPGLADLDDLRLAVLATRVGWFRGAHRIEVMGVHESYFGELPAPLSSYSPFRSIVQRDDIPAAIRMILADKTYRFEHRPDRFDGRAQQWFARWVYKGAGLDLGLYAASVLDKQGAVLLPDTATLLTADEVDVVLDHRRYTMVGLSGATTEGSWLFKWEAVGDLDRSFNTGDPNAPFDPASPPQIDIEQGSVVTGVLGITYTGWLDWVVSVEGQYSRFVDGPDDVLFPVEEPQFAVRLRHTMLDERLVLQGVATAFGLTADLGALARAEATYTLADGWKLGGGYVFYYPGDEDAFGLLTSFTEHDRVFARLRYDFSVL